jgi:glycerol-3-phosphate dehydrogenase
VRLANRGVSKIRNRIGKPSGSAQRSQMSAMRQELTCFPGLSAKVLSARSCVENEMCWTLEDYLRRRTNISQWVPRAGLGLNNENRSYLATIARDFPVWNEMQTAEDQVRRYEERISEFDRLLESC